MSKNEPENNGWPEYQKLVIHRLDELDKSTERLQDSLDDIRVDLITLKTKASLWGAMAGTLGGTIIGTVLALLL